MPEQNQPTPDHYQLTTPTPEALGEGEVFIRFGSERTSETILMPDLAQLQGPSHEYSDVDGQSIQGNRILTLVAGGSEPKKQTSYGVFSVEKAGKQDGLRIIGFGTLGEQLDVAPIELSAGGNDLKPTEIGQNYSRGPHQSQQGISETVSGLQALIYLTEGPEGKVLLIEDKSLNGTLLRGPNYKNPELKSKRANPIAGLLGKLAARH